MRRNRYEIHKLGNSDLNVSRICLGCMGFGDTQSGMRSWTLDEVASREIIRHALESGINFFDTAVGYQGGTSEQYVGRALKVLIKREDVVVATKFPGRSAQISRRVSAVRNMWKRCWIPALPIWAWTMSICTFFICGTITRPLRRFSRCSITP